MQISATIMVEEKGQSNGLSRTMKFIHRTFSVLQFYCKCWILIEECEESHVSEGMREVSGLFGGTSLTRFYILLDVRKQYNNYMI